MLEPEVLLEALERAASNLRLAAAGIGREETRQAAHDAADQAEATAARWRAGVRVDEDGDKWGRFVKAVASWLPGAVARGEVDRRRVGGIGELGGDPGAQWSFEIPTSIVSTPNRREHWRTRLDRSRAHVQAGYATTRGAGVPELGVAEHADVGLIYCQASPDASRLDDDNLGAALKSIRDGISKALGVDDGSSSVSWAWGQAPGAIGRDVVVVLLRYRRLRS